MVTLRVNHGSSVPQGHRRPDAHRETVRLELRRRCAGLHQPATHGLDAASDEAPRLARCTAARQAQGEVGARPQELGGRSNAVEAREQ